MELAYFIIALNNFPVYQTSLHSLFTSNDQYGNISLKLLIVDSNDFSYVLLIRQVSSAYNNVIESIFVYIYL